MKKILENGARLFIEVEEEDFPLTIEVIGRKGKRIAHNL